MMYHTNDVIRIAFRPLQKIAHNKNNLVLPRYEKEG
jgi:hypothetical protein